MATLSQLFLHLFLIGIYSQGMEFAPRGKFFHHKTEPFSEEICVQYQI